MPASILPVILCGGEGKRLAPLSTPDCPKQFMKMFRAAPYSLFQRTMERLPHGGNNFPPLIVGNVRHRDLIKLAIDGTSEATMLFETVSRNTGPSIAMACLWATNHTPDATLVIMPSDHVVSDASAFRNDIQAACTLAERGYLVTFGIKPQRPDIAYGYIASGQSLSELVSGASKIRSFLEKPDSATAQTCFEDGGYFWNSGIFVCKPATLLAEFKLLVPNLLDVATKVFKVSDVVGREMVLDKAESKSFPTISLDHALMEKTEIAAMIPFSSKWWDLGSIDTLRIFSEENLLSRNILSSKNTRFLDT